MKVESTAFEHHQSIPSKYTCEGEDVSPSLTIAGIPSNTSSIALIVDDPDAPHGNIRALGGVESTIQLHYSF